MKANKTLLFIVSVIALLALLCTVFPEKGVAFGSRRLFFPTLEEVMVREKSQSVTEKMDKMLESLRMQSYQDSLNTANFLIHNDSLLFYANFVTENPARIYLPDDDLTFFDSLFDKLTNCEERKEIVHILHYGDSQIEGDRITGLVRQRLQERFGGIGPGLLPAVQPIPSSAVGQTASENIERYIITGNLINKAPHNRYGALGQVAEINGYGKVSVTARNMKTTFENVKTFSKIRLFTSHNSPNFQATLSSSKESVTQSLKDGGNQSRILTWNLKQPVKQFTLSFSGSAGITGISVDGESGVAVDNIPLRGSSGTFFSQIDANSIAPVLKALNTQLIILEFGGNMMPVIKKEKHVQNYKESMSKQIGYLKNIYPDAKIILIGPADMSVKVNGRLQSIPLLKETIQGLKEAALENGAAFWDMYEVMGGENSMIDWVNNKPALAAPDYIHFTPRGADKIAEMFYVSLMNYYDFAVYRNNMGIE
jgi:lysophospholipase L1-like esterase